MHDRPPAVTAGDLHFGTLPDDPTGVSDCTTCNGTALTDSGVCPECLVRQQARNAWRSRR